MIPSHAAAAYSAARYTRGVFRIAVFSSYWHWAIPERPLVRLPVYTPLEKAEGKLKED